MAMYVRMKKRKMSEKDCRISFELYLKYY